MVRQLYLYSIEAADFPDSVTSENTLREFPLVIATVAKVSRKRGLWLVVRKKAAAFSDILSRKCCCFLFLQMISFSKRSAKSEFFLHSQIQDRLHQRDPALPG